MKETRKCWTQEEDQAIQAFVKRFGKKRWSFISQKMKQRFPEQGRSGKQCRERWHNHLNPQINKLPWSDTELKKIFDAHQKLGNKWTQIAHLLEGRTDNSVKNQFYSTLRKGLRRMCKMIGTRNSTGRIRKIKPTTLSNVISNLRVQEPSSQLEQQIYELLFIFSSSSKFQEMKCKTVSEQEKGKIQSLLIKILEFGDGRKKSMTSSKNNINKSKFNKQQKQSSSNSNEEAMDSQQQECENKQKEKILFNFNNKISEFDEKQDLFDLKLKKTLSLNKNQSNISKQSSRREKISFKEKRSSCDNFLALSPKIFKNSQNFFLNTPKMPTPNLWDNNPSNPFYYVTQETVDYDVFTDKLRKQIAENTSKKIL